MGTTFVGMRGHQAEQGKLGQGGLVGQKNCAAVGSLKTGQLGNNEFWGEKLLQVEIKDGVKLFL